MDSEVLLLTAAEALRRFADRTLSPVELMAAVVSRAEVVEDVVNALPTRFFDEALAAARSAEQRYKGKSDRRRPLEGLPLAVKIDTAVAGQPWTEGSIIFRDRVARHTAPAVQRAIDAGAIIHARSAASEFSCAEFTHSPLLGVTRNPWNPAFAPGGSSGGSAAALASGTTFLATGTDIGGSIRMPASSCGVVGYKPPYGRIPGDSPVNLDPYYHTGPLTRSVADCALFHEVLAGPHPNDMATVPIRARLPDSLGDVTACRIGLSLDLGGFEVDDTVRQNADDVADALRSAGAVVESVDLTWSVDDILTAAAIHYAVGWGRRIIEFVEAEPTKVAPYSVTFSEALRNYEGRGYEGLVLESRIQRCLSAVFAQYEVLICPTYGVPALTAGDDYTSGLHEGKDIWRLALTVPFNICSRCPVLSVPSGVAPSGVPTGVQVVGRPYDEASVFNVAAAVERTRPWLDRLPSLDASA